MQIFSLSSSSLCVQKAKEILYKRVDSKTVIFLSGGNTPKPLYEMLAKEEIIKPAAAGMVDERFGHKWHEKSNERMIRETGLLRYFEYTGVPWYPILQENLAINRSTTAQTYDIKLRELFFHFPKSTAVLGIGADGHTAGIPAQYQISKKSKSSWDGGRLNSPLENEAMTPPRWTGDDLVVSYEDKTGKYGCRITMTFTALSMVDNLIILAFGKDKKYALEKMFTSGALEEIPARIYNKAEISKKTMLFTDQIL